MADYYLFRLPKPAHGDSPVDQNRLAELDELANAVRANDKMIFLSGPHDSIEQKAVLKAVRSRLVAKGVPEERITTSKPAGEALPLPVTASRH